MKATGIVRRIDDLGRVVIPKEIRRTLRLREGDPLELFIDGDGGVTFKKYYPEATYEDDIQGIINSMSDDYDVRCPEAIALLTQAMDILKNREQDGE
jgi:stage V sporulation protein T